eukprot:gene37790-46628_t
METTLAPAALAEDARPARTSPVPALSLNRLGELPARNKVMLGAAAALLAGVMGLSMLMGREPEWRVLYANMNDRDGGAVLTALTQLNVPYKFTEGSGTLMVPAARVHDVRLRLASQGLPKGGTVGFELMENQKFGVTQFQERLNFQRGRFLRCKVPLTVDMENGYSDNPATVAAYIMLLVDSGVAGINIEDGGDAPSLLARKVEAIKDTVAKAGGDIFVNVRTDVYLRGLAPEGQRVQEVLARAEAYRAAGADGLFVPGITAPDEIRQVADAAGLPLNVMDYPGVPSATELGALGVRRFSAGSGIAQALWGAAREMAQGFLDSGNAGPLAQKAMAYGDVQQLFLEQRAK